MNNDVQAYLQSSEEKVLRKSAGGSAEIGIGFKVPVTLGEITFLIEEIFRGKSAVTGVTTRLVLVRWKKPQGSTLVRIGEGEDEQKSSNVKLRDLVCMTREEAARHVKEILQGDKTLPDLYSASIIEYVEARQKEAEQYDKWR